MKWLAAYREDIRQYTALSGGGAIQQALTQQGLWALMQYRAASAVYRSSLPSLLKRPLLMAMVVWQKLIEVITGIYLPYSAEIGNGLYIGHFSHIVLSGDVVMGCNCLLSQGVTIGVSWRGENRGSPVIGDWVYFGANATVAGKIRIGNDVVIGANSLVVSDVPEACTVIGVPAQVVVQSGVKTKLADNNKAL